MFRQAIGIVPFVAALALSIGLGGVAPPVFAQQTTVPKSDRSKRLPYAPATETTASRALKPTVALILVAKLTKDGAAIPTGLVWRVFEESSARGGDLKMVATGTGGPANFQLPQGDYLVHASYGRVGATVRIAMLGEPRQEVIVLKAGGLQLTAVVAEDIPVTGEYISFDIYTRSRAEEEGRVLILKGARPGQIIRLKSGTYEIVSRYGSVNAITSAEIEVEAGKLTEATMYHQAAAITLKLVNEVGGEALANTSWSVLTLGGDIIVEELGAFPTFVLAEGDYAVIAKHSGQIYNKEFSVEAGIDREEEITVSTSRAPKAP